MKAMKNATELNKWRLPFTRSTMLSVLKAFVFLFRVAPALCLGLILLTAVQGFLPGWNLTLLRSILATALEPGSPLAAYFPEVLFLALVIIAVELLGPLAAVVQESLSDKTSAEMGYTLGKAFVEIPDLHFLESPDTHDKISRTKRIRSRVGALIKQAGGITRSVTEITAFTVIAAQYGSATALAFLVSSLPYALVNYEFTQRAGVALHFQAADARKLDYYRNIVIDRQNAKEIRILGLYDFMWGRYQQVFRRISSIIKGVRIRGAAVTSLLALAGITISGGALWLVISGAGITSAPDVLTLVFAVLGIWNAVESLFFDLALMSQTGYYLRDYFDLCQVNTRLSVCELTPVPENIEEIEFCDVSFCYQNGVKALDGVSARLKAGTVIALVGPNGGGKSTLVKLLTRMYEPQAGSIKVNGIDIRHFEISSYREKIAAIFQDFNRYELSLGDNIALGTNVSRSKVQTCLELAGLDPGKFEAGLDTLLGKSFENGRELSGGQWQKVALARALLRDAPVLVLDEPSAALDVESEAAFYQAVRELNKWSMIIIVTHRLRTARFVDEILVLDNGSIKECGTHQELISQGGLYYRLYKAQERKYERR